MRIRNLIFAMAITSALLAGARTSAVAQNQDQNYPTSPMPSTSAIRILLAADIETTLSSKMAGTLEKISVGLGQRIEEGTNLAQFDCREATARARVAEAELQMTRQNLSAREDLRDLNAAGDLEVAMAETEVRKAEGARILANVQTSYCTVKAPFSGKVAKVYARSYQTISAGTPLFDIISDGPLKIRLNVPSVMLPHLAVGVPLNVDILETGTTYPATIKSINSRIDAIAQSIELEATLDQVYPELTPGMSGIATFPNFNG
ncbi:efflux RND transporter periplasmic adaptor subunit [Thalassospira xianhensis]|nr:efflux RND transporter periplasmic adaptor subunit [Thalassospira xianhensis]